MKKILIVDDELQIQEIYAVFFRSQGKCDISFASDGLEAFSMCAREHYDLITLDHQMPYMTGADFLKAVRHKDNLNMETPVIFISAFIPNIENALKTYDNTYFFDKPVDFEKLAKYAKFVMENKHNEIAG